MLSLIKSFLLRLLKKEVKVGNIEKKNQTIKKITNGKITQVRGDEINAKQDVTKIGNGSTLEIVKGDKVVNISLTIKYSPQFLTISTKQFGELKNDIINVNLQNIKKEHASLDEGVVDDSAQAITCSGTPATLATAIPYISGMLSDSSHGEIPSGVILNELSKPLNKLGVEYESNWTCTNCGNLNIADTCTKCGREKPK